MNKKLLGVLGVAALLLAGNFAWQEVKEVDAADERTIYLDATTYWDVDGAVFDAWVWGGTSGSYWTNFEDSNGDGIYEALIKSDDTDIIFLRKDPSKSRNSWDGEWGRIQTNIDSSNDMFDLSSYNAGTWKEYTYVAPTVQLRGTLSNWDPGENFSDSDGDGIYELELELGKGTYEFKVVKNGSWYGHEGTISDAASDLSYVQNSALANTVLEASGGNYIFEYNISTSKLSVGHKSYDDMVSELVSGYVSTGIYTKVTTINVDLESEDVKADLATIFHGKMTAEGLAKQLNKTTYYNGDSLWMTNSQGVNSGYGTDGNVMTHFKVTDGVAKVDYTVPVDGGMEGYYVTPRDFAADGYFVGWTKTAENTYELSTSALPTTKDGRTVLSDFIDVVAPLLYWEGSENYFTYSKLVVKKVGETLVLQIVLDATNAAGVLTSGDVLAEAVITKGCAETWSF